MPAERTEAEIIVKNGIVMITARSKLGVWAIAFKTPANLMDFCAVLMEKGTEAWSEMKEFYDSVQATEDEQKRMNAHLPNLKFPKKKEKN